MASMRDIKRRRDSIQSTGQITKAMKLVSTVKLQKAKGKAESTKPYSDLMYETVSNILAKSGNINHKFLKAGDSNKKAISRRKMHIFMQSDERVGKFLKEKDMKSRRIIPM